MFGYHWFSSLWLAYLLSIDTLASSFCNHNSAVKNSAYLSTYIAKELSYQSPFGPFCCNPFNTDCIISPLLCVPKPDSVELCVDHDLSFREGSSVNDGISSDQYLEQFFKLRLPGIDLLVEFVNAKCRGCYVFKKDLWRAYHQIPIDPQDYPLLGLYIDGPLFFFTLLCRLVCTLPLWSVSLPQKALLWRHFCQRVHRRFLQGQILFFISTLLSAHELWV